MWQTELIHTVLTILMKMVIFVGGSAIPETIYNQNEIEDDPYWNSKNWLGTGGVFNSTSFYSNKKVQQLQQH